MTTPMCKEKYRYCFFHSIKMKYIIQVIKARASALKDGRVSEQYFPKGDFGKLQRFELFVGDREGLIDVWENGFVSIDLIQYIHNTDFIVLAPTKMFDTNKDNERKELFEKLDFLFSRLEV